MGKECVMSDKRITQWKPGQLFRNRKTSVPHELISIYNGDNGRLLFSLSDFASLFTEDDIHCYFEPISRIASNAGRSE